MHSTFFVFIRKQIFLVGFLLKFFKFFVFYFFPHSPKLGFQVSERFINHLFDGIVLCKFDIRQRILIVLKVSDAKKANFSKLIFNPNCSQAFNL